jgi:hypothetical protein
MVARGYCTLWSGPSQIKEVILLLCLAILCQFHAVSSRVPVHALTQGSLCSRFNVLRPHDAVFSLLFSLRDDGLGIAGHGVQVPYANVLPEPTRRERRLGFEHLVDFLQGAVLDFGQVEVDPRHGYEARRAPDPAYTYPPCQRSVSFIQ